MQNRDAAVWQGYCSTNSRSVEEVWAPSDSYKILLQTRLLWDLCLLILVPYVLL